MQHECIPQAILGMDVICQAKSGMGKTAVFVLSTLQQIEPVSGQVAAIILCHTRELAYQVEKLNRTIIGKKNLKKAMFLSIQCSQLFCVQTFNLNLLISPYL